ncbi:hypothetical protein BJ165DRAFT_1400012 [Panaeolus papilionaceus]|nr:hypothetical protein BJ165DRAFT_1400012 [Panaeolus papilionaceus]
MMQWETSSGKPVAAASTSGPPIGISGNYIVQMGLIEKESNTTLESTGTWIIDITRWCRSCSSSSQGASARILVDNGPLGFKASPELEVGIVLGVTAFLAITFLTFKMYFSPKSFVWRGNPAGIRSKSEEVVQSKAPNIPLQLLPTPFQINTEASQHSETLHIVTEVQHDVDTLPPLETEIQAGIHATEDRPTDQNQHTEHLLPNAHPPTHHNHPEPETMRSPLARQAQVPDGLEIISIRSRMTDESSLLPPEYQSAWGGNAS